MKRLLLVAFAIAAAGCATKSMDLGALSSPSDQVVWDAGQKALKRRDWSSARQYFKRIVDAFPQSEHQADARIAVADSYFDEGGTASYVLAVSAYHEFLTLYPLHPRSDHAQFRAADAYFKQRNSPDRDQTQTKQALEEYEKLLDVYPQSSYVEQARARIKECRQTLARSNYLVGFFYQRGRQAWRSAIGRYQIILDEFPDYDRLDEVIYRYAECLAAAGRYAEALPQIGRIEKEFPQSGYVADAQKLRNSFPAAAPAAPPPQGKAPAPSPTKPGTSPPAQPPATTGGPPQSAPETPVHPPTIPPA